MTALSIRISRLIFRMESLPESEATDLYRRQRSKIRELIRYELIKRHHANINQE
jgi:hypothetical protein